ncbi:MAG TPA: DUF6263 family protein [Flavobacteriaceae bacterium]|nr:DUF6263 family protein [Flavobacteriaceae bacterium]
MWPKSLKAVVLFLLAYNSVLSQQNIAYHLSANKTYKVEQNVNQEIVQQLDGTEHIIQNSIKSTYQFKTKSITDSSFILQCRYTLFKLKSTSNLYGEIMNINTDSIPDEENMESKLFSGLTQAVLNIELLKTGKVKKVDGTENLINQMIANADIEEEFTKAVIKEAMTKEFGDTKLANSFEQMMYIYPVKKVHIGDTWTNSYTGELSAVNTWTLNTLSPNITISGSSNITFTSVDQSTEMILKGTQNTTITCNKKTGFIETMLVRSKVSGNTILKESNALKIPTYIITTTSYKTL